jgi:hypothetical protein
MSFFYSFPIQNAAVILLLVAVQLPLPALIKNSDHMKTPTLHIIETSAKMPPKRHTVNEIIKRMQTELFYG